MLEMTGVILAGGKSTRMNTDKAFINLGQNTMVKKIALELGKVFSKILIIDNKPEFLYKQLGLPVVKDLRPGCGPLGGIHAGLVRAATPYIFVTACDMPFVDARLIPVLTNSCYGFDAVVPQLNGYEEPLFAVYGKSSLPAIEYALNSGHYRVVDLLSHLKVKYINESALSIVPDLKRVFMNINTPRDFNKAISILRNYA